MFSSFKQGFLEKNDLLPISCRDKPASKLTKVLIIEEVSKNSINSSNTTDGKCKDRVTKRDKISMTKDQVNLAFCMWCKGQLS